ncbi:MAG: hypothetical protein ACREMW_01465 [Gemmatimonadales bacterium]
MLLVVNHHWLDVVIYLVQNGTRTRVATVSATTTRMDVGEQPSTVGVH